MFQGPTIAARCNKPQDASVLGHFQVESFIVNGSGVQTSTGHFFQLPPNLQGIYTSKPFSYFFQILVWQTLSIQFLRQQSWQLERPQNGKSGGWTCARCMLFSIKSFSRVSAPKSEEARGNEIFSRVRTGLGITWKKRTVIKGERKLTAERIEVLSPFTCGNKSGVLQTIQNNLLALNPTTQYFSSDFFSLLALHEIHLL